VIPIDVVFRAFQAYLPEIMPSSSALSTQKLFSEASFFLSQNLEDLAEKSSKAVVAVTIGSTWGSGVLISPKGCKFFLLKKKERKKKKVEREGGRG